MGLLVKTLVSVAVALLLFSVAVIVFSGVAFQEPSGLFITVAVAVIVVFAFCNYREITIQLTHKELRVSYGLFNRKRILVETILSCKPTKASFGKYLGVGFRYGSDGSHAYTTSFGDAVEVIPAKGRPFVFSSHNPEKICQLINSTKNTQTKQPQQTP
jgi:hypothetical protein